MTLQMVLNVVWTVLLAANLALLIANERYRRTLDKRIKVQKQLNHDLAVLLAQAEGLGYGVTATHNGKEEVIVQPCPKTKH